MAEEKERARGGCLTALLAATLLFTPLAVLGELKAHYAAVAVAPARMLPNAGYLLLVLSHVLDFAFVIAIFRWKKWGVYGYLTMHAVMLAFGIALGQKLRHLLLVVVLPAALMVWLVSRVGEYFD